PPLPESGPAALPGLAARRLRERAVRLAGAGRAVVRQRGVVRGRPGAAAGLGARPGAGTELGLGQAPHQRRSYLEKTRTYVTFARCCPGRGGAGARRSARGAASGGWSRG